MVVVGQNIMYVDRELDVVGHSDLSCYRVLSLDRSAPNFMPFHVVSYEIGPWFGVSGHYRFQGNANTTSIRMFHHVYHLERP